MCSNESNLFDNILIGKFFFVTCPRGQHLPNFSRPVFMSMPRPLLLALAHLLGDSVRKARPEARYAAVPWIAVAQVARGADE
jgi:hypothetical protein